MDTADRFLIGDASRDGMKVLLPKAGGSLAAARCFERLEQESRRRVACVDDEKHARATRKATSRDSPSDVTCRGIVVSARYWFAVAARSLLTISALASAACGRVGFGERSDSGGERSISDGATCATCDVGLVAHWPFDETSGTIARDIVGGHDLTMEGFQLGWGDGVRGGAATMTYGYGKVSWDLAAAVPTAFTIALWQLPAPAETGDFDRYFSSYFWDGSDHGAFTMDNFNRNGVRCIGYFGGSWEYIEANGVFSPTDWRHVACVYNSANATLSVYGNGVLLDSRALVSTPLMTTEPHDVAIGTSIDTDGAIQNASSGRFDDVRVYNRALSPEEIAALGQR